MIHPDQVSSWDASQENVQNPQRLKALKPTTSREILRDNQINLRHSVHFCFFLTSFMLKFRKDSINFVLYYTLYFDPTTTNRLWVSPIFQTAKRK